VSEIFLKGNLSMKRMLVLFMCLEVVSIRSAVLPDIKGADDQEEATALALVTASPIHTVAQKTERRQSDTGVEDSSFENWIAIEGVGSASKSVLSSQDAWFFGLWKSSQSSAALPATPSYDPVLALATDLHYAILGDQLSALTELVKSSGIQKAIVHHDTYGLCSIHNAAELERVEFLKILAPLLKGCIDVLDGKGYPALQRAFLKKKLTTAQALLALDARPEVRNKYLGTSYTVVAEIVAKEALDEEKNPKGQQMIDLLAQHMSARVKSEITNKATTLEQAARASNK
jgi:hypothetical protein